MSIFTPLGVSASVGSMGNNIPRNDPVTIGVNSTGSNPVITNTITNNIDEQTVKNMLQADPNNAVTPNFSIKQPMCAGGKIQLPTINRSDVLSIKNKIDNNKSVPMINDIQEITINNIISDDDLCYNRCPNGEDPVPDSISGQYICLIPATVTYKVISGVGAETDPNAPILSQMDKIDYSQGYSVSCQSTDLNTIGLEGKQFDNKNLMFGTPVLKKSGLYENPARPSVIRSIDNPINGNLKWFCKRPVFGSPTINQVQSKYQFINNIVTASAKPVVDQSSIDLCRIPNGGWTNANPMPLGCSVITNNDSSMSGAVVSSYLTSLKTMQNTVNNAAAASGGGNRGNTGAGDNFTNVTNIENFESPYDVIQKPIQNCVVNTPVNITNIGSISNSSDFVQKNANCDPSPYSQVVNQAYGLLPTVSPTEGCESIINSNQSSNMGGIPAIASSVNKKNTAACAPKNNLSIVSKNSTIPVPQTETIAQSVNGVIQTIQPSINQKKTSEIPQPDPGSCMDHLTTNWVLPDPNNQLKPDVRLTTTHNKEKICGYSMYYKGINTDVNNGIPLLTRPDIELASINLQKRRNVELCSAKKTFDDCRSSNNASASAGMNCINAEFTLNKFVNNNQRRQLDNLCNSKPNGDFTFVSAEVP
jgi:hypothetical protein